MLNSLIVFPNNNYRPIHDANPASWPSSQKFRYSKNTSTTSLRPHIERNHLETYLSIYKEKGWKVLLPGLMSQARSQAASEASASRVSRPDLQVEFSQEKFHQYLLNFIIVDDQVRALVFLHVRYTHVSTSL